MTTILEQIKGHRDLRFAERGQIIDQALQENRGLTASEQRKHDKLTTELAQFKERISELEDQEQREKAAGQVRIETGQAGRSWSPGIYQRGDNRPDAPSFFKDVYLARVMGDPNAWDRLRRNEQMEGRTEYRSLGNTGATGGSGGEFSPPAWLIEDFVRLARPGRVTADLLHKAELPSGISTVNLPKVVSGTTTAVQTTQNTALSQTDMTTSFLSSGIVTIGGKQIVSQQLIDQSGTDFDQVVLGDLAADYARQLGVQVISGTGTSQQLRGYLAAGATSPNIVTWSPTTPGAPGFYSQLAKLQGQINATRYMTPDAVVMHPRRWAWFASYTDANGRPLVVPEATAFNGIGLPAANAPMGHVGTILGMDVYTDPNIPTNLGSGTNQDTVLMFKRDDLWLWESPLQVEAFRATYADQMGVLYRAYGYTAAIFDRYTASLGQLTGTGLVAPTYQS